MQLIKIFSVAAFLGLAYTAIALPSTGGQQLATVITSNSPMISDAEVLTEPGDLKIVSGPVKILPPTCVLTTDKEEYSVGEPVTFTWTTENANKVVWVKSIGSYFVFPTTNQPLQGSYTVTASKVGNPFGTIKVSGLKGSAQCTKAVSVVVATQPPPVATTTPPVATTTPPVATTTPPTTSGLVAHWKFDDTTGTDSSGTGATGTLVNGPTATTSLLNSALQFDGVDDRVDIVSSNTATSPLRNILRGGSAAKSFTITAWVNQKSCTTTNAFIVGRSGFINGILAGCNNVGFSLYRPDNTLANLSGTIANNKWYFVVGVYDQPTGKMWLFVNGFNVGEADAGPALRDNTAPIQIGGQENIKWYFNGLIDDVRVYNRTLSGSEIKDMYYAVVPKPASAPKTPQPVTYTLQPYSWNPLITSNCSSTYRTASGTAATNVGSDCASATSTQRWLWGTTLENSAFTGGSINDFFPGDPVWQFAFHDRTTQGRYAVSNTIDKVTVDKYRDRYTFAGFTDQFGIIPQAPPLTKDIHVMFDERVVAADQQDDGVNGPAKNRVMIGTVATWNNRAHYLEVNLWKTPNFDLCTGPCDSAGAIDRHFYYTTGEGIYYDVAQLGLYGGVSSPSLTPGGTYQTFDIPLTQIYQATEWSDPPASWDNITLGGVYYGIESWGKGKVTMDLKNVQTAVRVATVADADSNANGVVASLVAAVWGAVEGIAHAISNLFIR